ncbi:Gamma-butyrobetaine hydroxylase-like N-terminal [Balamuthia mandrillaris]
MPVTAASQGCALRALPRLGTRCWLGRRYSTQGDVPPPPTRNGRLSSEAVVKPLQLTYKREKRVLEVQFEDGKCFRYPAEYLRVHSPSAEMKRQGQDRLIAGRKYVGLIGIHPVGNYAVQLEFDDLHRTGIYTWQYLYKLGTSKYELMRRYIRRLQQAGKSRHPARTPFGSQPSSSSQQQPLPTQTT